MYRFAIIGCGRISHKIAEGLAGNKDKAMLIFQILLKIRRLLQKKYIMKN